MAKTTYEEVRCKSVLNRVRGMDFAWSINPYRGCVHSCHYCFARRYHAQFDLDAGADFTSVIFVKVNAPEVLRLELSRPSWRRETVTLGTATDPYQPIEGKFRITRGILEALRDFRTPVAIVTKRTMIVRDADVLAALSRRASCTVCHSVTTLDEEAWRRIEPGTPPPRQRLRAMERLAAAGVNAGVLLAPIVPGITDSPRALEEVARAAAAHGARFLGHAVLRLQGSVKEHFGEFLRSDYPELLGRYQRLYPGAYAPWDYKDRIDERMAELRERYGFGHEQRTMEPQGALSVAPQAQLALAI